ncbi:M48 family metallopeptidase [Alcanivorax sp. JB21]|uniref:M48 family metallopeptidase n=1 Tax=Alcanivorax limicola TaxID=2874102 RepID=UPI001CBC4AFA|nr:SprT family zinc-dependent metalloprotease [Alcanivorax limicola]MBZ2188960.1 M48 family metallopeptidase [Alcanivorax limicola]
MADLPYTLIRSRRRSLELRVLADQRLEVRAPERASERDIRAFVESRRGWIERTLARMAERPAPLVLALEQGARHPLLGQPIQLAIRPGPRRAPELRQDQLHIQIPDAAPARVATVLDSWYREQARTHFNAEIDRQFPFFADRGHARPLLRIKRMKSRWGSLSSRGYINLNLALIQLPRSCLEYVVAHELCHLEHMDHGPGFHRLMDQRLPDWRARKALLNRLPLITHADDPS